MSSKNINKVRFVLVLFAILAYSVQSFAYVGTMGLSSPSPNDKVMTGCHGEHKDSVQSAAKITTVDCCEGGCSMMGCHAPSALLSSIYATFFHEHQTHDHDVSLGIVAKLSTSLYRPPILR